MKVGLNLYSIKNLIQTEEDFTKTAIKLREIGYDFLQFSGASFDLEIIKRVVEKSGLPIVLTHVPEERIVGDTDNLIKEHLEIGCFNIGLGCLPPKVIYDEKEVKSRIDKLNLAGKKMAEKGFKFFYHNHHFEFIKMGDKTVFDYIVENAPYINFTADTYWLQYGGVSITEYLKKIKGRVECVHLKDYKIIWDDEVGYKPVFAPIGDGNIDFKSVIKVAKKAGAKYFIVEQDDAGEKENPLAEVEKSVKYLKNNF